MANHGFVFDCKVKPTSELLLQLINQFNKQKMNSAFKVEKDEQWGTFSLVLNDEDYVSLWIGSYYKGDDETDYEEVEAIELRHGHTCNFMWWVDFKLQHYLAYHLKGKMADEGIEDIWEAETEDKRDGETYAEYAKRACISIFKKKIHKELVKKHPEIKDL